MTIAVYPNPVSFSDIKIEFGAVSASDISLGSYYAGGSLVPSGATGNPQGGGNSNIPSSGALSIDQFHHATHPGVGPYASSRTYNIPYGMTKLNIKYWDMSGTDLTQSTATTSCTPGGTVTITLGSDATVASTLSISGYGTLTLPLLRKPIVRMQGNVDAEFAWYISLNATGGNNSGSGTQGSLASVVSAVGGSISFYTEVSHGQLGHSIYYYPVSSTYMDTFSSVISDAGFPTFVDAYSYRNGNYPPYVFQTPTKANGYSLGCWERDEVADEGYNDVQFGVYLPNYILNITPTAS